MIEEEDGLHIRDGWPRRASYGDVKPRMQIPFVPNQMKTMEPSRPDGSWLFSGIYA